MTETSGYFVVRQKALPEVLIKVVEAKKMIDSEKGMSVQRCSRQSGDQSKFFL